LKPERTAEGEPEHCKSMSGGGDVRSSLVDSSFAAEKRAEIIAALEELM